MNLKRQEAIEFVESQLNQKNCVDECGLLRVMDEATLEKEYGWVFFVNTEKFIETKDRKYSAIGIGPIVFSSCDKKLHILPTCYAPTEAVKKFEHNELSSWKTI